MRLAPPDTYTPKDLADRILTSRAALEGERKHVTVLFADLKGSLELLADRDPEDARKILDPVLEHMMAAVHRFEGTVNQVMGDGIMALFGAPLAHEDHALRACYAALAMQQAVKRYADEVRRSQGAVVKIRVGLNSGEVVVRTIGSDLRMDYTAVGQTTHLAARMEQFAEPGTIMLAPGTLALAEGRVEVKPVGPVAVRGFPTPLDVYELTGAGPSRTRLQATAARRGLTRFVGRDVELETLRRAQDRAGLGDGQVVAVVGEAGVGKSRLVYEFARSHRLANWLVLEAAAVSYGTATGYGPVVELLKRYFKIESHDDLRAVREKVTGKLLALDRTLEWALPPLLALLDVPLDEPGWHALDPRERRERTLGALRALWSREAREQPLLLIVEDLHWIDPATQAVLDALVDALPSSRLLLLANFRGEYSPPWKGPHCTQLRVDSLGAGRIDEFLDALVGTDAALADLKRLLMERTDGNPFFLEESVGALVDTGALVGSPGAYRPTRPIATLEIPESVHAVLAARIDRLPDEEKTVLAAAAAIGQDVPLIVLREIVEASEPDLRRGLAHLQAAGFLDEAALFPDLEYTFRHALTHDVAYGNLLQPQRRALHARIVEALERVHRDRLIEHVERLADHALKGELWGKATEYLRQAASRAALRAAYREALTAFERALGALAHLPESHDTKVQAIDLRLDLRAALAPLGQYARILDGMREAETLARDVGDRRRLGLVLADLGARLRNVGDHQRALAASRSALEIAAELPDEGLVIEAKYRLAQAHFAVGDFPEAGRLFREAADALTDERAARRVGLPGFFAAWPRAWLGLVCSHRGRFNEAMAYAEGAVRIADAADHPHTVIEAYGALGGVSLERGDLGAAQRVFERGEALLRARHVGDANILSGLGYTYVLAGRLVDGLALLEESLGGEATLSAMGLGLAVRVSRVADAYRLAGRAGEALERARAAVDLARTHGERANEASALRVLADVLTDVEPLDTGGAEHAYTTGLARAETCGMRALVAHCHAGLARLRRRTGERQRAQEHLALAGALYRELGMTFWLTRATEGVDPSV